MTKEFIVTISNTYPAERDYIFSVIFKEFLGLDYIIQRTGQADVCISENDKKRRLIIPDGLFAIPKEPWLTQESLPKQPLEVWDPSTIGFDNDLGFSSVPVIYGFSKSGLDATSHSYNSQDIRLPIDVFGSCFFMLSRYEEVVLHDRDEFDRFPANASLAYKAGFLYRPIVDEYVEILWACMKHLWPQLGRKPRQGKVFVTCDVDQPYDDSLNTPAKVVKRIAGDLLKRRNPKMALQSARNATARLRGDWSLDPYNTFDWMMDTCERTGKKIAFYFLCQNASDMDARYELSEVFIKQLLKIIHLRGHEIGMHGSYNTYQNPNQIRKERTTLLQACESLAIDQTIIGNRQHYLRWDATQTPDHLSAAGFEYDTSGSFADAPGFRYGTSRPSTMWSWQKKAPLKIKQRPLVVMDGSVIDECYLGLSYTDEALNLMLTLKRRALQFGGDFTLVWHNSHFMTAKDREYFEAIIN